MLLNKCHIHGSSYCPFSSICDALPVKKVTTRQNVSSNTRRVNILFRGRYQTRDKKVNSSTVKNTATCKPKRWKKAAHLQTYWTVLPGDVFDTLCKNKQQTLSLLHGYLHFSEFWNSLRMIRKDVWNITVFRFEALRINRWLSTLKTKQLESIRKKKAPITPTAAASSLAFPIPQQEQEHKLTHCQSCNQQLLLQEKETDIFISYSFHYSQPRSALCCR